MSENNPYGLFEIRNVFQEPLAILEGYEDQVRGKFIGMANASSMVKLPDIEVLDLESPEDGMAWWEKDHYTWSEIVAIADRKGKEVNYLFPIGTKIARLKSENLNGAWYYNSPTPGDFRIFERVEYNDMRASSWREV